MSLPPPPGVSYSPHLVHSLQQQQHGIRPSSNHHAHGGTVGQPGPSSSTHPPTRPVPYHPKIPITASPNTPWGAHSPSIGSVPVPIPSLRPVSPHQPLKRSASSSLLPLPTTRSSPTLPQSSQFSISKVEPKNPFTKIIPMQPLILPSSTAIQDDETRQDAASNSVDTLIPIRLELDLPEFGKLTDTFSWNLHDTSINKHTFATVLCQDLKITPTASVIAMIVASITLQLASVEPQVMPTFQFPDTPGLLQVDVDNLSQKMEVDAEGSVRTEPQTQAESSAVKAPPSSIPIYIDITLGLHRYVDRFEWAMCQSISPEAFASLTVQDLGMDLQFTSIIAHSIREQILSFKRNGLMDEDGQIYDVDGGLLPQGPSYRILTLDEADRIEKDAQRDLRRIKRNARRNVGNPLTFRTVVAPLPGREVAVPTGLKACVKTGLMNPRSQRIEMLAEKVVTPRLQTQAPIEIPVLRVSKVDIQVREVLESNLPEWLVECAKQLRSVYPNEPFRFVQKEIHPPSKACPEGEYEEMKVQCLLCRAEKLYSVGQGETLHTFERYHLRMQTHRVRVKTKGMS